MANQTGFQLNTTIHAAFWIYKPDPAIDPIGREVVVNVNDLQYVEANQPLVRAQNFSSVVVSGGVLTVIGQSTFQNGQNAALTNFSVATFLNKQILAVYGASGTGFTANYSLTASVTYVSVSNNVLTVQVTGCAPVSGMIVTFSSMSTGASFLNGQSVTILTAQTNTSQCSCCQQGPPITTITASLTATNYGGIAYPITATSITGNTLTVTVNNNYQPDSIVTISGSAECFLNGQTFTVVTPSATQFTATINGPTYTNSSDMGTVTDADTGTLTLTSYGPVADSTGQGIDPASRTAWLYYAATNVSQTQQAYILGGSGASGIQASSGVVAQAFLFDFEDLFLAGS